MNPKKTKKAFSMLFVIAFIVVLGTLGTMMLFFAASTVKKTTDNYLYAQAELYAKSSGEYAVMAVQAHDFSANCLDTINIDHALFDVNMTLEYFMVGCPATCNGLCHEIETQESNGTFELSIYVTSKTDEEIRFFRQLLLKP